MGWLLVCKQTVNSGTCANGVKVGIQTSLGNLSVDSGSDHGPAEMSAFVRCVSGVLCYEAASHRPGFSFYFIVSLFLNGDGHSAGQPWLCLLSLKCRPLYYEKIPMLSASTEQGRGCTSEKCGFSLRG